MAGIREIFALNLRLARRAAGVSQEELADLAGLDRTYISSMERCVYAASIDVVDRVATALEVKAADLLREPDAVGQPRRADGSGRKGKGNQGPMR